MSTYTVVFRILAAFIIGGLIGINRERRGRAAGLRTHILVSVGSALTVLCGIYASDNLGLDSDPLRLCAQVISGIGFLGVGTILITSRSHVLGLTTAAGLWATAAIGIACGLGFYIGAVLSAALCMLAIALLNRFENQIKVLPASTVYIELSDAYQVNYMLQLLSQPPYRLTQMNVVASHSQIAGHIGLEAATSLTDKRLDELTEQIASLEQVVYCIKM